MAHRRISTSIINRISHHRRVNDLLSFYDKWRSLSVICLLVQLIFMVASNHVHAQSLTPSNSNNNNKTAFGIDFSTWEY